MADAVTVIADYLRNKHGIDKGPAEWSATAIMLKLAQCGWPSVPLEPNIDMREAGEAIAPGKAVDVWKAMTAIGGRVGRPIG